MSDLESESRTQAVGRKRSRAGDGDRQGSRKYARRESTTASRSSSLESGEVSSSNGSVKNSGDGEDHPISLDSASSDSDEDGEGSATDSSGSESGEISSSNDEEEPSDPLAAWTPASAAPRSPSPIIRDTVRIHDLSAADQAAQLRYFKFSDPNSLAHCLCCGAPGHARAHCPARTCPHCSEVDAHAAWACPTWRKCARCRQRGHDSRECRNQSFVGSDPCDVCSRPGHREEECSHLWGAPPMPLLREGAKKVPYGQVVRSCFECGEHGVEAHWGDDCPYRDRGRRTDSEVNLLMCWSAKWVDQFVERPVGGRAGGGEADDGLGYGGGGEVSAGSWQTGLLDGGRD